MSDIIKSDPICFIINSSAIGDTVASIPVIKYAIEKYKDYFIIAPPEFRDLFFFVPDNKFGSVFEKVVFDKYYSMNKLNIIENKILQFHGTSDRGVEVSEYNIQRLTPLRIHLSHYASLNLLGQIIDLDKNPIPQYPKELLSEIDINKYGVDFSKSILIPVVYRAENRKWDNQELLKLTSFIKDKGLNPVYIGKSNIDMDKNTPYIYDNNLILEGKNLVDKTSLKELIKIMYSSKALLGIDNGLLWLGGMTNIDIIGAYNVTDPKLRKIYRNFGIWDYIIPDIECKFCQSDYIINNHDFSFCYLKHNECLQDFTAEKFILTMKKNLII